MTSGLCVLYTPHTTAGLAINEGADPDVARDVLDALEKLVPWRQNFRHTEGNSAAHIKSILTGGSAQVIIDSAGSYWVPGSGFFCVNSTGRGRERCTLKLSRVSAGAPRLVSWNELLCLQQ